MKDTQKVTKMRSQYKLNYYSKFDFLWSVTSISNAAGLLFKKYSMLYFKPIFYTNNPEISYRVEGQKFPLVIKCSFIADFS